jgi:hypothetical protein
VAILNGPPVPPARSRFHSVSGPSPSLYLLARARETKDRYEVLRVYEDIFAACQAAVMLSEAEPRAVYRVTADGRRTVLLATAGRGHWVRIAR